MKGKIIVIFLVCTFLLGGLRNVYAQKINDIPTEHNPVAANPWIRPYAFLALGGIDDIAITVEGQPIDPNSLDMDQTYNDVIITGIAHDEGDLLPLSNAAISFTGQNTFRIISSIFMFMWLFTRNDFLLVLMFRIAEKFPGIHNIPGGPITINIGKMFQSSPGCDGKSFACQCVNIQIS